MNQDVTNIVLIVMAVGSVIVPVLQGFIIFKLMSYFVSKQEFDSFKQQSQSQHEENKQRMFTIETDIKALLARE